MVGAVSPHSLHAGTGHGLPCGTQGSTQNAYDPCEDANTPVDQLTCHRHGVIGMRPFSSEAGEDNKLRDCVCIFVLTAPLYSIRRSPSLSYGECILCS